MSSTVWNPWSNEEDRDPSDVHGLRMFRCWDPTPEPGRRSSRLGHWSSPLIVSTRFVSMTTKPANLALLIPVDQYLATIRFDAPNINFNILIRFGCFRLSKLRSKHKSLH
jgi:hypothetical protein